MQKKTIMVVSTGRADYGLLYPLIKKIMVSANLELQLIATGTHLSPLHGKTIKLIEEDNGVQVTDQVEMTMKSDTENSICISIATGLMGFSQLLNKYHPDILVVLGDRYELWSVCMAAVIHKIPIAHIHGGETTFGLIDDPIRHSVTKMSAFHFASIDLYARRIVQMGEDPGRVFVVGAIGLDNIKTVPLMTRKELSEYAGVDFEKKIVLMTYHPVTLDNYGSGEQQIQEILNTLVSKDLLVLMTMPNQDPSGNLIYQKLEYYSQQYPEKFKLVKNLGQKGYLSAMKYARLMIGNSSSGIIESASFKLPVVNIGDRQGGRFKPKNVIDCICSEDAISNAITQALSDVFKQSIINLKSPYGDGNTATRIVDTLESIDFSNKSRFLKKGFYDLKNDLSQIKLQGMS
jgi:UDP-hydrolysing UDP-N-acetyl-D-glucosamine 2-epimerase